ncbi:MAG: hypothetical protein JWM80_3647 [Cyanobacteria bacterium RYN_339]|nr:hypothetical protein [Cyanobacteria bacterium RYN_339]
MRSPTPLLALLFLGGAVLVCTNQPIATAVVAVGIAAFALGAFLAFRMRMRRVAVDAAMLAKLAESLQATGEGLGVVRAPSALAEPWRGYREALVRDPADGRLRSGEPAAAHFNAATVIERRVNLGLFQAIPGLLVGIGICFTFLGLAIALQQASLGISSQDVAVTQAALRGLYGAASFKFVTSIVALACSVLFTAAEKRLHHDVMSALDEACMALDRKFQPVGLEALLGQRPVSAPAAAPAPVAVQIDPEAIGRAVAAALAPMLESLRQQQPPPQHDLGGQLEAMTRQAAQLHQGMLVELFNGQNQVLEASLGRQRQGLEGVVAELERVLKRDLELRAAGQAEHGRAILALRETTTELQAQAGTIGRESAARIHQMAELTSLVGAQVAAVDKSYAGLVASLDAAMAGSNEQLKRYLETAESRQTHFFDTYDMAVTKLYEKLLQAANYLAEAAAK